MSRPLRNNLENQQTVTVSVSRMKSSLSQFLRIVKSGKEITVTDRDRPVARLVPYVEKTVSLQIKPATRSASDINELFNLPPLKTGIKTDSLSLLLEDRGQR
jgi:prevent-host-death family protein